VHSHPATTRSAATSRRRRSAAAADLSCASRLRRRLPAVRDQVPPTLRRSITARRPAAAADAVISTSTTQPAPPGRAVCDIFWCRLRVPASERTRSEKRNLTQRRGGAENSKENNDRRQGKQGNRNTCPSPTSCLPVFSFRPLRLVQWSRAVCTVRCVVCVAVGGSGGGGGPANRKKSPRDRGFCACCTRQPR
jgi:hypothetical protein